MGRNFKVFLIMYLQSFAGLLEDDDIFLIRLLGLLVTLCKGANIPYLAAHSKYRFSPTEPSFLPIAESNSTPAHSPAAKSVVPMNLKVPVLVPVWLETITLSPNFKGPPPVPPEVEAKLRVLPAGDGVLDLFNLVMLLEGDMEALALEATVVLEATKGVSGMDCPACLVRRDVLENIPCMGVH